jgi:hypothetical protein
MHNIISYRLHNPTNNTGPWTSTRLRQPWMTDLACRALWLIFEFPAQSLGVAGLAAVAGGMLFFASQPRKHRVQAL